MRIGLVRWVLTGLVCFAVAERLPAELIRAGSEFQANTYTFGTQRYPSVALDTDFDFVVVWQALEREDFLVAPADQDERGSLLNDAAQKALERFDETQRELASLPGRLGVGPERFVAEIGVGVVHAAEPRPLRSVDAPVAARLAR